MKAVQALQLLDDALARLHLRAARLTRRFDERPQRERIVLLLAAVAVSFWLADKLWLTPAYARMRAASTTLGAARGELDALRQDQARLQTTSLAQQRALQADIAATRQRVESGAAALRAYGDTLVGADRMVELLEQMLPRHGRLKLVELRSLGRADLLASPTAAAAAASAAPAGMSVYRHGVELMLEGSYADLNDYLQALESSPRRVLWGGFSMKVEQHPKVVMTLRLYTLSLDSGWLAL